MAASAQSRKQSSSRKARASAEEPAPDPAQTLLILECEESRPVPIYHWCSNKDADTRISAAVRVTSIAETVASKNL
jgi:hypothetical protein